MHGPRGRGGRAHWREIPIPVQNRRTVSHDLAREQARPADRMGLNPAEERPLKRTCQGPAAPGVQNVTPRPAELPHTGALREPLGTPILARREPHLLPTHGVSLDGDPHVRRKHSPEEPSHAQAHRESSAGNMASLRQTVGPLPVRNPPGRAPAPPQQCFLGRAGLSKWRDKLSQSSH